MTITDTALMYASRLVTDGVLEITETGRIRRLQTTDVYGGYRPLGVPFEYPPGAPVRFRYAGEILEVPAADLVYANTVGRPIPETDEVEPVNLDVNDTRRPNLRRKVKDPPQPGDGYRRKRRKAPS